MKKSILIICIIFVSVICLTAGYFLGNKNAQPILGTTFYAVISERDGSHLLVDGLEINDINSRGQFYLTIDDDTILEWRSTEISVEDLKPGVTVSITYTGEVQETDPAGIDEVLRVQLLEDVL
ncbi:MAG: hypothetical protein ACRC3H_05490 [Lachnospiraceae bacterium]